MAESKVKCSWLKQFKTAKGKVAMKEKKHENVKLKEEDVPGAILPFP